MCIFSARFIFKTAVILSFESEERNLDPVPGIPFRGSIVPRFPVRFDGGDRKHQGRTGEREREREKEGVSSNVAGRGLGALMGGVH